MFGMQETIFTRIQKHIQQIQVGVSFGERLIIIAERGTGKTSTLFHLRDKILAGNVPVYMFSWLPPDIETLLLSINSQKNPPFPHLRDIDSITGLTQKPIFLLFDFPDAVDSTQYRHFLTLVWSLMTNPNYDKINLIFSMNPSHYNKSFSIGETLGKFLTLRLEKLSISETEELIESRLEGVGKTTDQILSDSALESIFKLTKGVPRYIISTCRVLYDKFVGEPISGEMVDKIFKDKVYEQIIKDRVEDSMLRAEYLQIISILKTDFGGVINSKLKLVEAIQQRTGLGKYTATKRINELLEFGIFSIRRGGYNRMNKLISLE